jgi:hypothetical protein
VSFGFTRPPVQKGDYVEAVVELVNNFTEVTSVKKVNPPSTPQAGLSLLPPATSSTGTLRGDARQDSIIYQSSRKDALSLIGLLISQDALPISVAKTAAGKAKRYEEVMALVDKLTVQYFYDVSTLRNLDRVQDGGAEAAAPAGLPEDDQETQAEAAKDEPTGADATDDWS